MSDLINNVEAVYKKWQARSQAGFNNRGQNRKYPSSSHNFSSASNYRSSGFNRYDGRRYRKGNRNSFNELPKYDGLAYFKMAPTVQPVSKSRPFMGTCCDKCLSMSKANVVDNRVFLLSISNVLHIPHFQNLEFKSVLNVLSRNQKTIYPDVSRNIGVSKKVLKAVEHVVEDAKIKQDLSQEESSSLRSILNSQIKAMIDSLGSTVSVMFLQFSSIGLRFGLSRIFDGVLVHKGQIEILKSINQNETPIIYVPIHYNTFDHFLISFILYMNSIHVPLVVTDCNLYIPVIGCLLKFFGAIYIQKSLEKERDYKAIYWTVLQNYFTECLRNGHSLEFPLDGGRSRSGRPQLPDPGYLSVIMDSVLKGHIEDAYVSTVSISYEKMLDQHFINEQLGQPPLHGSFFSSFCSIWRLLHCKFGNIRFNISQPFSIKEFFRSSVVCTAGASTETPPSSPCSLDNVGGNEEMDFSKADLKQAVSKLAKHISYDITSCTAIMSTHLVAFLLLTQFRKGATQQQLENSIDWLRAELLKKRRDTGFSGVEAKPILLRAISLLGRHIVSTETVQVEFRLNDPLEVTLYTPVDKVPEVIELQFYARSVVPVFLMESAIANGIYVLVDVEICHFRHCDSRLFVSRDKLVDKATDLIEILQFEFTATPPCADVNAVINEVIDSLIEKECLHLAGAAVSLGGNARYSKKSHALCFDSTDEEDSGEEDSSKQRQLKIDLSEESIGHLEFLRNILSPYIESYWLAATTLLKLVDEIKEEANFIQEMQNTAQEKLYRGLLAYEESFSADTFKNALKLFEHWQVIESYVQDNMKIVYLSDVYNCKEKIGDIISKIEDFRK